MAFVQANHAINDASGTALAVTLTGVVAGNTISGQFTYEDPSTSVLAVSDGTANVYTVADNLTALSFRSATFYCKTTVGGSLTITATPGGACTFRRIQVREDSGLGALDQHVINQSATFGTGADACTSTAKVTAVACTVLGYYYDNSAATIPSAGTGATLRDGFTNAAGDALAMDEKVQGGAGSVAATFTTTGGTDNIYVGMLAFQPAAVASLGFTKQPGPGVSPSKRDQFKAAPRSVANLGATIVVNQTIGAYSWAGTTSGTQSPSPNFGAIQGPGPGIKGPFNNGQFVADPRGFIAGLPAVSGIAGAWAWTGVTATTSQLVNAIPGAWSWAGTTGTTSQLVNQSVGTWSWAGTTSATTQLINAAVGAYTWAGTTAGTTQLLNATPGAWSWAGTTASLDNGLNATLGVWSWAGTTATTSQLLSASPGAWSWSGTTANLGASVDATPGRYSWAGVDAGIPTQITLIPGAWGWAGVDATIPSGVGEEYGKKKRKKRFKVGEQVFTDQAQALNALLDEPVFEPVAKPAKVAKAVDEHVELIKAVAKALPKVDVAAIDWAALDEEDIEMLLLSL